MLTVTIAVHAVCLVTLFIIVYNEYLFVYVTSCNLLLLVPVASYAVFIYNVPCIYNVLSGQCRTEEVRELFTFPFLVLPSFPFL